MSRLAVAMLLVLALVHTGDAGVFGFLGEKTEQIKNDTKVVIAEAEKRIKGLFSRVDQEKEVTGVGKTVTTASSKIPSKPTGDEQMTTTPAPREILAIVPRCGGDEVWDNDSEGCVPELG